MNFSTIKNLGIAGAAGLIIGALLPWVSITSGFGSLSKNGIEGDGIFTAAFGLIALILVLRMKPMVGKRFSIPVAVIGILTLALLAYDLPSISNNDSGFIMQIGVGFYLTGIGAILLIYSGLSKPTE